MKLRCNTPGSALGVRPCRGPYYPSDTQRGYGERPRIFVRLFSSFKRVVFLVCLLLLSDCRGAPSPEQAFAHARQTFIHGNLLASQEEAERGYERFAPTSPEWA